MKKIDKLLLDLLDVEGPNTTNIKVSPDLSLHINNFLMNDNKDFIVNYCKKIPDTDLTGIEMFKRHTGQDKFLGLMLMAIGEHFKIWNRFPSTSIPWNLSHFPCVVRAPEKKLKHIEYKEEYEESVED